MLGVLVSAYRSKVFFCTAEENGDSCSLVLLLVRSTHHIIWGVFIEASTRVFAALAHSFTSAVLCINAP